MHEVNAEEVVRLTGVLAGICFWNPQARMVVLGIQNTLIRCVQDKCVPPGEAQLVAAQSRSTQSAVKG